MIPSILPTLDAEAAGLFFAQVTMPLHARENHLRLMQHSAAADYNKRSRHTTVGCKLTFRFSYNNNNNNNNNHHHHHHHHRHHIVFPSVVLPCWLGDSYNTGIVKTIHTNYCEHRFPEQGEKEGNGQSSLTWKLPLQRK